MLRPLALISALILATPASAQVQPGSETIAQILFETLATSQSQERAKAAEQAIWDLWTTGPDETATLRLRAAMDRRAMGDFRGAAARLDPLIETYPDWAEAWNQRAFARFLAGDFAGSLADIERTLALEPRHFGALAGQAQIYARQGDAERSSAAYAAAVTLNPWIAGGPPGDRL